MSDLKNILYEQVSRVSKALASPKRLELIELLCQCEKSVETLARETGMSVKLASAHLRALRTGRLVETRKDGKYVLYRLADASVADLWVSLRSVAEERLVDLQVALRSLLEARAALVGVDRKAILRQARQGEVIVIDVRPRGRVRGGTSSLRTVVAADRTEEAPATTAQGQAGGRLLPRAVLPDGPRRSRPAAEAGLPRSESGRWCGGVAGAWTTD